MRRREGARGVRAREPQAVGAAADGVRVVEGAGAHAWTRGWYLVSVLCLVRGERVEVLAGLVRGLEWCCHGG